MQVDSLITPTDDFTMQIPVISRMYNITFSPVTPEKGGVYVCTAMYKIEGRDDLFVDADNIIASSPVHGKIHLPAYLWNEIQPPMEINIEEIVEQEEPVLA